MCCVQTLRVNIHKWFQPHSQTSFTGLIPKPHSQTSFPGLIQHSPHLKYRVSMIAVWGLKHDYITAPSKLALHACSESSRAIVHSSIFT